MGISLETLILARQYADKVAAAGGSEEVVQKIISTAVAESKLYTDKAIGELSQFKVTIVDKLPTSDIDTHMIYFVAIGSTQGNDSYYEYMYINNKWELIGTTQIDLSNYWTIEEVKAYFNENKYILPTATQTTLGGVKVDGDSILISTNGVISTNSETTQSIAQSVVDANFTSVTDSEIDNLFK